jgi:hypothetical protein
MSAMKGFNSLSTLHRKLSRASALALCDGQCRSPLEWVRKGTKVKGNGDKGDRRWLDVHLPSKMLKGDFDERL